MFPRSFAISKSSHHRVALSPIHSSLSYLTVRICHISPLISFFCSLYKRALLRVCCIINDALGSGTASGFSDAILLSVEENVLLNNTTSLQKLYHYGPGSTVHYPETSDCSDVHTHRSSFYCVVGIPPLQSHEGFCVFHWGTPRKPQTCVCLPTHQLRRQLCSLWEILCYMYSQEPVNETVPLNETLGLGALLRAKLVSDFMYKLW